MTPVSIAFDDFQVQIGETTMTWEQAQDLCERLDIVVRYYDMYM